MVVLIATTQGVMIYNIHNEPRFKDVFLLIVSLTQLLFWYQRIIYSFYLRKIIKTNQKQNPRACEELTLSVLAQTVLTLAPAVIAQIGCSLTICWILFP